MKAVKWFLIVLFVLFGSVLIAFSVTYSTTLNFSIGNLLPGLLGAFILATALAYDFIMRKTKTGPARIVRLTVTALVLFGAISFAAMCVAIFAVSRNVPEPGHEAVIVLGAGLDGASVTTTLALRLEKAMEYLMDNENCVVVVSGGQGRYETVTEAYAMKNYLIRRGVAESRIIQEDRSTSTEENFLFSKQILDLKYGEGNYSVVYVTNDFHLLRAGFYAEKAGLDAEGLACASQKYMLPNYYTREYLAVLWYLVARR